MSINYIDGIRLHRSFTAGLKRVVSRQEYLNKINVFPVPDGDTGTNMAYTLTTIEGAIHNKAYSDIRKMSMAIADSALDGARGNSGAILAQFLVGFADGVKDKTILFASDLAAAAIHAKNYSYDALVKPREGTILSVIREWSEALVNYSKEINDIKLLLSKSLSIAQRSLNDTPKHLDVLAKAGVLDAGAQGFVDILEGIQDYIDSGLISEADLKLIDDDEVDATLNEKFRYCTECIISGEEIPRRLIQERLMDCGDSIVLAGTKTKVKVHIHSDEPGKVFKICNEFGSVKGEKTDDMIKQQSDAHKKHLSTAIIIDSGGDLPDQIQEDYNIHMIPVRLNFGDTHYVDKVSLSSNEFWNELEKNPIHPQTSQPSPGDFRRQYKFLSSHYESAVSIHIPSNSSGTFQSALTASKAINKFPIKVVDSYSASIGLGLIALSAAEAVKAEKNIDEIFSTVDEAVKNTSVFLGLETLDNVVKGGRISKNVKKIANLFRLNPILSFSSKGMLKAVGVTIGNKNKANKFRKFVEKKIPKNTSVRIGIAHAKMEDYAKKWANDLKKVYGSDNVIVSEMGPALAVHSGPGGLVFSIQKISDQRS